jgi:hypothetical protein
MRPQSITGASRGSAKTSFPVSGLPYKNDAKTDYIKRKKILKASLNLEQTQLAELVH